MKRVCLVIVLLGLASSLSAQSRRSVLIRAAQPYDALVRTIEQAGGTVTHRFKHVKGIAADVPESALAQIERLVGPDNVGRDEIIPLPAVDDPRGGAVDGEAEADDVVTLDAPGVAIEPANYIFNATLTNVAPLHAAGQNGAGVVIAVIDSGYRPVMLHVAPSRIISPGLNLVPGATEPPAISNLNEPHGTFVSGMAAANVAFCFSAANKFVVVAEFYGGAFARPTVRGHGTAGADGRQRARREHLSDQGISGGRRRRTDVARDRGHGSGDRPAPEVRQRTRPAGSTSAWPT